MSNVNDTKRGKGFKGCFIVLIISFCIFLLPIIVFILWGFPSHYKFHVTDEKNNPIQSAELTFVYDRNLNVGGMNDSRSKSIKLFTDENGDASYWGFVKYFPRVRNIKAEGYYETRLQGTTKPIVLRKKKSPVPMYTNKDSEFVFPGPDGEFRFDLEKLDFLPPHGEGVNADFVFILKSHVDSYKKIKVDWDISFTDTRDGIKVVYSPPNSQEFTTFQGPYEAPESGYLNTYRKAELEFFNSIPDTKNWAKDSRWDSLIRYRRFDFFYRYNPVFCFRIRSKSGKPLYGKIYGNQPVSGQGYRNGKFRLYLQYYLNPDGTRNLEHSYNLFKKH